MQCRNAWFVEIHIVSFYENMNVFFGIFSYFFMGGNTSGIFAKVPRSRRVTGSRPMEHLDDEACNTLFLCFQGHELTGKMMKVRQFFF